MRVSKIKSVHTNFTRLRGPETLELTVLLEEGDTVKEAVNRARLTADREFGRFPDPVLVKKAEENNKEAARAVSEAIRHNRKIGEELGRAFA